MSDEPKAEEPKKLRSPYRDIFSDQGVVTTLRKDGMDEEEWLRATYEAWNKLAEEARNNRRKKKNSNG